MSRLVANLETAVAGTGLTDGMRISFHHHLRLGDRVVERVLDCLEEMGFSNLTLCASSLMGNSCEAALKAVRSGLICRIETTGLKEPLSSAVLDGELPNPVVFRSHGGRARAIESGETPIHTAFIAVSCADSDGNGNGVDGPNRFGSLGYAMVDSQYAGNVILITDYLSDTTLEYKSIPARENSQVVKIDSLGDREMIGGGSLRFSKRPLEKLIAERALEVIDASGYLKEGFCFQAGSGGISLLAARNTADLMRSRGITGEFASGGVTAALTGLLEEGLFHKLYDVQSFDDVAARSLGQNPDHLEMSASFYANPDNPGCIAHKLDVMLLSATEVDIQFNVNSISGTDGRILGALGGAPDTAEGAQLTIVVMPSFRGRIPTINRRVNLICTPGSLIDVLVTERGICVNPLRKDLERTLWDNGIKTMTIQELLDIVYNLTGIPSLPEPEGSIVGLIEGRRGEVLDTIRMG